ncbi:MAG: permease-like cell division protein FtsX, partial [candidate division Zixibacteria bacterium]|nr:permease-like cell division protein FtsX [candidate division Zixibacteria bacterium]
IFILRELARSLYRHPGTVVTSLLSTSLLILLFNLFWVVVGTSERFYKNLLSEMTMDVFLSEELPDSNLPALTGEIKAIRGVLSVLYISKDMARQDLASQVGTDLLVGYDSLNPRPRSYSLSFESEVLNLSEIAEIAGKIQTLPGVMEVSYSRAWLEKVENTKSIILEIGLVFGLIIFSSALISSANNIRLMTRTRVIGFQQMLLLGAGRMFISLPFFIEGFLIGGLSAVLSWLIIFYGYHRISFTQIEIVIPDMNQVYLFCLATALLGGISGYLGVRKLLK